MREQCYNPFLMEYHFSCDFGLIQLDAETGRALSAVPKRKDFNFDRRYSQGRAAARWEAELSSLAKAHYSADGDVSRLKVPPFRPAA